MESNTMSETVDQQPADRTVPPHLDLLPHHVQWARCSCERPSCDRGELRIVNDEGDLVALLRLDRKGLDWQVQQAKDLAEILSLVRASAGVRLASTFYNRDSRTRSSWPSSNVTHHQLEPSRLGATRACTQLQAVCLKTPPLRCAAVIMSKI